MADARGGPPSDRLSDLPDAVLHEIFALLPLPDLVRTAALSKKWRRLWPTTPVLDFASVPEPLRPASYAPVLRRCLRIPDALRRLTVIMDDSDPDTDLDPFSLAELWASFAEIRSVRELYLTGCIVTGPHPLFFVASPPSLFACRSLTYLYLANFTIPSIPSSPTTSHLFPLLADVTLSDVSVDAEAVAALLAACPCIDSLCLIGCEPLGRLVVRSPTLRTLQLLERPRRPTVVALEIAHAPVLRSVALRCDLASVEPFKDLDGLRDVTLFSRPWEAFETRRQWVKFIQGVEYVHFVSVNHWFFQFIGSEDVFWPVSSLSIEELHLCGEPFTVANLLGLALFLKDSCPVQLYLHGDHPAGRCDEPIPKCEDLSEDAFWELIQQKCDHWKKKDESDDADNENGGASDDSDDSDDAWFDSLREGDMAILHTVVITGFSGKKEEMMLLKFVMEYAKQVSFVHLYYPQEIGEERLADISKEIESFRRAYSRLKVSFSKLHPDHVCMAHDDWWYMSVLDD